jgi:hexosaminidase
VACVDTLDPTSDDVYAFLRTFLVAVSALFPDPYFFLGGDEVLPDACWGGNARIAAWLAARNMSAAQLQPYFWRRVWAEVLPAIDAAKRNASAAAAAMPSPSPAVLPGVWLGEDAAIPLRELPAGAYVNVWQNGAAALAAVTSANVSAVASAEWYVDVLTAPAGCKAPYASQQLWRCFWAAEPAAGLSAQQARLLLGGQVSAWGEGVSAQTLDARLWSRAAAAAERLWSPPLADGAAADHAAAVADAEERLDAHICRMRFRGVAAEPIRAGFCVTDLEDGALESEKEQAAVVGTRGKAGALLLDVAHGATLATARRLLAAAAA